jgi:lipopolysaccharide/colanic/teichoic acid biosynthesis glycosyltransferase
MQNDAQFELIQNNDPKRSHPVFGDRRAYYAVKRIMDIVISITLLALLCPFMLLIALMILVYSPGPVFFVQERVGAKRQGYGWHSHWKRVNFRCYKFRTMKVNADHSIHQAYVKALIANNEEQMAALQGETTTARKLIHDSRIIHPGVVLRKWSLDELPQLWNVLRGDMSLVGPRPAIPYEVEMYQSWHLGRLLAQPGITGLQQVTARSIMDFDKQIRLDIEYIQNQSIWLDFKIILQTPFAIISRRGAH